MVKKKEKKRYFLYIIMNKKDLNFFIFLQMVFFLGHFSFLLYKKKNGVKLPYLQKI